MEVLRWIRVALGLSELLSVYLAAPVSLIYAWVGWIRSDRSSSQQGWRERSLFVGLLAITAGAALYLGGIPIDLWWTRVSESTAQKQTLNGVVVTGAICCMLGMLAAAVAKGRARFSVLVGGFFGLFMFVATTPLAYLP